MESIFKILSYYADNVAVGVTVVAALATLLRKFLEQWLTVVIQRRVRATANSSSEGPAASGGAPLEKGWRTHDAAPTSHSLARSHVRVRLNDAKNARTKAQSTAKISRLLSALLTFAQVVIGGVLASSFIQETLSARAVGMLGVLVLIASLMKQQYRPEVDAEQAREKASKLQALIRLSEDQLATIDARSAKGEDRTDALIELRDRISRGLAEIENPETISSKARPAKSLPQHEPETTE